MAKEKGTGSGPTKQQVDIAKDLRSMMSDMATLSSRIERSYESQAASMAKIAENMRVEGMTDSLSEINSSLKEIISILKEVQTTGVASFGTVEQSVKKAGQAAMVSRSSFEQLQDKLNRTGENALSLREKLGSVGDYLKDKHPVAVGAALGAMSGLAQGFRSVLAIGKSFLNFGVSVVKSLFKIGMAIISIPFKMLKGLVSMASSGGGGNELAQAYENVRKEFGQLSGPVASTIISATKNIGNFSAQGISSYRVLGNLAERMETFTKLFVGGGAAIQEFTSEFEKNGDALVFYQRGLGLTDEQMGVVAQRAKAMGTDMGAVLNDMTKQSYALGDAFGVSAKLISKDMGKALQDTKHFAQLTVKEIGQASVYARKLGLELDKITGVLDAFETFDQAAESVSKLNETFGTNLNATELMNAQNPADVLDKLRKGFSSAGVAGETLNRAQLKMASSLTGMDEGTVKLALSSKNAGKSLEQIKKESEKAEKKTLTQTQAMSKLADAIERLVKSGGEGPKGFFESFFKGFTDGIQQTAEFRGLMISIRRALFEVYQAGRQVGRAFVEYFPGVKDFLTGLKEIFSPGKFRSLAQGVKDVFIQFFKDLNDPNGKASFASLMTKLKAKFFDFFNSQGAAGQKVLNGFKTFSMAVRGIVAGMIKWVLESFTGMVKGIIGFIKNPTGLGDVGGAVGEAISPMAQAFREAGPPLWEALKELFGLLFDKLSKWFQEEAWPKIKPVLIGLIAGPMVARALLGAGTAILGSVVSGMITKAFAGQGQKALASEMSKLTAAMEKANAAKVPAGGVSGSLGEAAKGAEAAGGLQKAGAGINWGAIGTILIGLAGVIIIGLLGFYAAIKMIQSTGAKVSDVIAATMMIVGMAFAAIEVALAAKLLSKSSASDAVKATTVLIPLGLMILALAVIGGVLAFIIKSAGIGVSDVAAAVLLINGMAFASLMVGLLAPLLAAISVPVLSGIGLILGGLGAIALMIAAIAYIGYKLVDEVKKANFTIANVELAAKVISLAADAISVAVLAMGAAFKGAFFGILGGIVRAFGGDPLGPLKSIIIQVVGLADMLVQRLPSMPPDIKPRAEALAVILDGVTKIINVFPTLMESLEGGFLDTLFGRVPKKIAALSDFVEKLFGSESEGKGIIGIIKMVIGAVEKIGASEQALKAAESLGPIMSAVAEIAKAMVMPEGMGEAIAAIEESWFDNVDELFTSLGNFSGTIAGSINKLLGNIADFLNNDKLKGINKDSAAGLASILQALGPILQALTPPPGVIDAVKAVAETWTETTFQLFNDLNKYIDKIREVIVGAEGKKGILEGIKDFINGISGSIRGLNFSESTAKVFEGVSSIIGGVSGFVSKIIDSATKIASEKGDPKLIAKVMKDVGDNMPPIFKAMAKGMPKVIDAMLRVIGKIPVDKSVLTRIENVGKVLNLVKTVIGLASEVMGISGIKPGQTFDAHETAGVMARAIDAVGMTLMGLVNKQYYNEYLKGAGDAPLPFLLKALAYDTWAAAQAQLGKMVMIGKIITTLSKIGQDISGIKLDLKEETTRSRAGLLSKSVDAIGMTLRALVNTKYYQELGGQGEAPLPFLITALEDKAWDKFIAAQYRINSLGKVFSSLSTMSSNLTSAVESIKGLGKVSEAVKGITAANLQPLVTAVADTIAAAQSIGQSLEGVRGIDLSTKLQNFMTSFGPGMGAVEQYTVQSKDVVINVNFRIALEVDQVEKTIIEAGDSVIKDRINLLIDAMPGDLKKTTEGTTQKDLARLRSSGNTTYPRS